MTRPRDNVPVLDRQGFITREWSDYFDTLVNNRSMGNAGLNATQIAQVNVIVGQAIAPFETQDNSELWLHL